MHNNFPKIALGTWLMGGTKDPDPNNDDEADIQKILLAINSGVRLIDTAQNYANGKCEELVGKALRRLDPEMASEVRILTKHSRLKLSSREEITSAIDASFKRLGVDKVDYYLLHAPATDNNATKLKDYFDVVDGYVESGLIKNIGVSNFSIDLLEYVKKNSKHPIVVNQVSLNIFNRKALENGLFEYCLKNGIEFQSYRPLADLAIQIKENEFILKIAEKNDMNPMQVALAYLFSKGSVITISSSTPEHWMEIFAASRFKLNQRDLDYLENNIKSEPNPILEMDNFIDTKLN